MGASISAETFCCNDSEFDSSIFREIPIQKLTIFTQDIVRDSTGKMAKIPHTIKCIVVPKNQPVFLKIIGARTGDEVCVTTRHDVGVKCTMKKWCTAVNTDARYLELPKIQSCNFVDILIQYKSGSIWANCIVVVAADNIEEANEILLANIEWLITVKKVRKDNFVGVIRMCCNEWAPYSRHHINHPERPWWKT